VSLRSEPNEPGSAMVKGRDCGCLTVHLAARQTHTQAWETSVLQETAVKWQKRVLVEQRDWLECSMAASK
jgi:hypothetical protein